MPSRISVVAALALTLTASGCDQIPITATSHSAKPATLAIQVSLTVASIAGVTVEVSGPGISVPTVVNLPITNGIASGTVQVLAGSDRVVTIRAFDTKGIETNRGSTTIDVVEGTNPTVSLVLEPLTGGVPIDALVGSYALTITPTADTLVVGDTLRFTATVTRAGVPVASPVLVWATSNPAFATVVNGKATALYPGTALIVVNYQGFAAAASLTVQ